MSKWLIEYQYHNEPANHQVVECTEQEAERIVEDYNADQECSFARMKNVRGEDETMITEIYKAIRLGHFHILGHMPKKIAPNMKKQSDIHELTKFNTWDYDGVKMLKVYSSMVPWGMMVKGLTFYQKEIAMIKDDDTLAIAHIPFVHPTDPSKNDPDAMAVVLLYNCSVGHPYCNITCDYDDREVHCSSLS